MFPSRESIAFPCDERNIADRNSEVKNHSQLKRIDSRIVSIVFPNKKEREIAKISRSDWIFGVLNFKLMDETSRFSEEEFNTSEEFFSVITIRKLFAVEIFSEQADIFERSIGNSSFPTFLSPANTIASWENRG